MKNAEEQYKAEPTQPKGGHRAVPLRRFHFGILLPRGPLHGLAPIGARREGTVLHRTPSREHGELDAGKGGRGAEEAQRSALPLRVYAFRRKLQESPFLLHGEHSRCPGRGERRQTTLRLALTPVLQDFVKNGLASASTAVTANRVGRRHLAWHASPSAQKTCPLMGRYGTLVI